MADDYKQNPKNDYIGKILDILGDVCVINIRMTCLIDKIINLFYVELIIELFIHYFNYLNYE